MATPLYRQLWLAVLGSACLLLMVRRHRLQAVSRTIHRSATVAKPSTAKPRGASSSTHAHVPPLKDSLNNSKENNKNLNAWDTYTRVFLVICLAVAATLALFWQVEKQPDSRVAVGFQEKSITGSVATESPPQAALEGRESTSSHALEAKDGAEVPRMTYESTPTEQKCSEDIYAQGTSKGGNLSVRAHFEVGGSTAHLSTADGHRRAFDKKDAFLKQPGYSTNRFLSLALALACVSLLFVTLFDRMAKTQLPFPAGSTGWDALPDDPFHLEGEDNYNTFSSSVRLEEAPEVHGEPTSLGGFYGANGAAQSLKERDDEEGDVDTTGDSDVGASPPTQNDTKLPISEWVSDGGAQDGEETLGASESRHAEGRGLVLESMDPLKADHNALTVIQEPETRDANAEPGNLGYDNGDKGTRIVQHELGATTLGDDGPVREGDGSADENRGSAQVLEEPHRPDGPGETGNADSPVAHNGTSLGEVAESAEPEGDLIETVDASGCQYLSPFGASAVARELLLAGTGAVLHAKRIIDIEGSLRVAADSLQSRHSNKFAKCTLEYTRDGIWVGSSGSTDWWKTLERTRPIRTEKLERKLAGGTLRATVFY